jgi:hypothetical protein
VLKEQRIAFHLAAVDQFQELRPQLSLQRDRWNVLHSLPNRTQAVIRESKRDGVVTEFHPNRDWVGRKRTFECNGSVEPREKDVRFLGIEDGILQFNQLIAAPLEHDPLETIRGNADEALAFRVRGSRTSPRRAPDGWRDGSGARESAD